MTEDQLIRRFVRHFAPRGRGLALGPGDDCAILRPSPGHELCATTDALVEGVHFDRHFSPEDIGHKALAVNLSDLAAMGAAPRWFLLALELPPEGASSLLDGLARGMAPLARVHGCVLAGGNLSRGPHFAATITALGEVPRGKALRRDGLRPGDVIAVTGTLGAAALGLRELRREKAFAPNVGARRRARGAPLGFGPSARRSGRTEGPSGRMESSRQLRPVPRVAAGLAARGIASAAMDVSDGLALDLSRLCGASGCGAELWASALPAAPSVRAQRDWLELCLHGGEDYELLLGVRPARWPLLRRRLEASGTVVTEIGRAAGRPGLRLAETPEGGSRGLSPRGFLHF